MPRLLQGTGFLGITRQPRLQEIKTGKAYQQTKNTVMDASSRFMTMTEPHVRKAKILLKPLIESIVAKLEYAKEAISRQLQENKYRAIVQHAQKIQDFLREFWLSMVDHVAGILDSDMVRIYCFTDLQFCACDVPNC